MGSVFEDLRSAKIRFTVTATRGGGRGLQGVQMAEFLLFRAGAESKIKKDLTETQIDI